MIVPARISKDVANAFVRDEHRHHDPDQGGRFYVGAWDVERGCLCGVGVVGRPRAPALTPYKEIIAEVTRVATDGTFNACSFIYARCASLARDLGFHAVMTYTIASESGASLRALGWWPERLDSDDGATFANRPGRKDGPRADWRWAFLLGEKSHVVSLVRPKSPQLDLLGAA